MSDPKDLPKKSTLKPMLDPRDLPKNPLKLPIGGLLKATKKKRKKTEPGESDFNEWRKKMAAAVRAPWDKDEEGA
jgi:hypothetical protein